MNINELITKHWGFREYVNACGENFYSNIGGRVIPPSRLIRFQIFVFPIM